MDPAALLVKYLRDKFAAEIALQDGNVDFPAEWRLQFLEDCNRIVQRLVAAYCNKKYLDWSIADYSHFLEVQSPCSTGRNETLEAKLQTRFPPLNASRNLETQPFIVVDKEGHIVMWYLPGILGEALWEQMWKGVEVVQRLLAIDRCSKSWRLSDKYYMAAEECTIRPGTASFSPAWFQQAHAATNNLEVSATLRTVEGLQWLCEAQEANLLIGGILGVIHPALYETGRRAVQALHGDVPVDKGANILELWALPFTSVSIMNNRQTPVHHDSGGGFKCMDLLATVGPYTNGEMDIPTVGIRVRYSAGTMVGITRRALLHAAKVTGERACFAYYMRHNVLKHLNLEEPGWAKVSDIDDMVADMMEPEAKPKRL
ncbi:unnamed protein product [Cyclocybe aegerita]|uniref:2OGFeDO JBP1/TET oxygenase domain-containing protein n=1 Tax=Cyclocybe aegerita TaxID=1973307 RepID=A0A8S0VY01_CYCAE|nr:unnamed protein product [Cyclocybe aegerita]